MQIVYTYGAPILELQLDLCPCKDVRGNILATTLLRIPEDRTVWLSTHWQGLAQGGPSTQGSGFVCAERERAPEISVR